ncbi:MAG: thioredoxin [Myxococcaceae bacterium]|jgi:thiol-disulfide isomerase/thioredoxin|nr:thioredoxin [Myxococcaceae bacterium]
MRLFFLGLILAGCTKAAAPTIDPAATVRFITPPIDGDVANIMSAQRSKSKAEGRQVLLYCGASWCEPCRFFHEAVDRGELTGKLGALDLVAFDAQVDAERMLMAGYESQFIPLFAAVGPDGKGTGKKIEGSVKGPGAVDDLVSKLQGLLAEAPR